MSILTVEEQEDLGNAFIYVAKAHSNQFRKKTGIPYFSHCVDVMNTVTRWGFVDVTTLKAAIAHDVLEDCPFVTEEMLLGVIGQESFDVVKELTFKEVSGSPKAAQKEQYMHSFRNSSLRALCVKLADRYCNILDFTLSDPDYAKKYWKKAQPLFDAYLEREREVRSAFGQKVTAGIYDTCEDVMKQMSRRWLDWLRAETNQ